MIRKKGTPVQCWNVVSTAIVENGMRILKTLKLELSSDPAIPLLGVSLSIEKLSPCKDNLLHHGHCSFIHSSQDMETNYVYING
jgi:hypothetical protein